MNFFSPIFRADTFIGSSSKLRPGYGPRASEGRCEASPGRGPGATGYHFTTGTYRFATRRHFIRFGLRGYYHRLGRTK